MNADQLTGVIPAHLMAFDDHLDIDEIALLSHVEEIVSTPGVTGITTNGHAAEVATLTVGEQRRTLEVVVRQIDARIPVVCGIYEDGTAKAVELARMAEGEGASALLVFPSSIGTMGGRMRPEMAYAHLAQIADATKLPIIVFEYPVASGLHIETDELVRICNDIDNVTAVKEWSNDIYTYERNYRALKSLDKPISVLSSYSIALLASLTIGADGILSGHGSIIAADQARLFQAVTRGDLALARSIAARIFPVVRACYSEPFLDMHNRMKEISVMLGRLPNARVRPPLQPISDSERKRLWELVEQPSTSLSQGK